MRRVHAKSRAHKPQTKSGTCACHSPSSDYTIFSGLLFARPNFLFAEARGAPSIHWHSACILHTHILYSLLISRWDRQSGAAESAPLYTNHFIARRPSAYNIPWWAWSLRPRRPTMSCAAPPPLPPGRQGLHCYTLCCESLRPALIAQSTITHALHIRWLRRGKSWKISRNTLLARTRFICIGV